MKNTNFYHFLSALLFILCAASPIILKNSPWVFPFAALLFISGIFVSKIANKIYLKRKGLPIDYQFPFPKNQKKISYILVISMFVVGVAVVLINIL